ncbi:hypothetical protein TSUD_53150, partial [Trifolium subterraneum]
MVGRLLKEDGTPDKDAIKRLFDEVDINKDSHISRSELEQIVKKIQFGKVIDAEEANTKLYKYLDVNKDNEISEQEFVDGFMKWISLNSNQDPSSSSSSHETHQTWEDVEKVMKEKQSKGIYGAVFMNNIL